MKYFYLLFFILSTSLFSLFQTLTSSSEAECKGRKTFPNSKKKIKLFSFSFVSAFQASPLPPKRSAKVEKNKPHTTHNALFIKNAPITNWNTTRKNEHLSSWRHRAHRHEASGPSTDSLKRDLINIGWHIVLYISCCDKSEKAARWLRPTLLGRPLVLLLSTGHWTG